MTDVTSVIDPPTIARIKGLARAESGPGNAGSKFVSDFVGGSRRVYAANFLGWLLNVRNDEGSTYAEAGSYMINPSSNVWFGPRKNPFRTDALSGDFVLDVVFSVASSDDVGINFQVFGPEPDPNYLSFFIEFLGGRASYGIDKGWIKHNNLVREQLVAEREPLAPSLSAATLRRQTKLTIKHEGGDCQVFINDVFVRTTLRRSPQPWQSCRGFRLMPQSCRSTSRIERLVGQVGCSPLQGTPRVKGRLAPILLGKAGTTA